MKRDHLYKRHHLSHQQIDDLLDDRGSADFPELKGQMLAKVHDFIYVSNILSEAGIQFIPIKGPMLSYRLYKDPSYRYFSDLDLLMEVQAVKKSIQLLQNEGYESSYKWPTDKKREEFLIDRENQVSLHNPDKNIRIELHWKLIKYNITGKDIFKNIIRSNQTQISYAGQNFQILNNEFELLYLTIHGGLHAWQWLKWLVDVKDFLQNVSLDEDRFIQLTESLHAGRVIAVCNALLAEHFPGTKLFPQAAGPSPYLLTYCRKAINDKYDLPRKSIMRILGFTRYRMKCFPGIKYKVSVMKHLLYSSDQLQNDRVLSNPIVSIATRVGKILLKKK
ncbi:MAG: nucleotidyltransferase family protein [Bacteroidota bacterium]